MGLDIAELMIAFEEEFKIDICELDAQRFETVGDAVDYFSRRLVGAPTTPDEAVRNRREGIRQATNALSETLAIESSAFGEETLLNKLFPLENRNELWESVRNRFPDCLPELERDFYWYRFLIGTLIIFTVGIGGIVYTFVRFLELIFFFVFFGMIVVWSVLIIFCRSREKIVLPFDCRTVKGLAHRIIPDQIAFDRDGNPWTREGIERQVKAMFAEQFRIEPHAITLSTKFYDMW